MKLVLWFRQELQSLRKDNAGLDSNCHEQDKVVTHLRTRVAVLEQEVQDKEEVKRKTNELYAAEQEQKVHETPEWHTGLSD